MSLPLVTIVGRPNVGKSTLFNRVIGRKKALVYDRPGITRDRHYAEAEWGSFLMEWVDTGGYEVDPHSDLFAQMRRQIEIAIDDADLLLLVVDGRAGLVGEDLEMAARLRRRGKKIFLVVNKIDLEKTKSHVADFYKLGLTPMFPVSAEHGRGISDLLEAVVLYLQSIKKPDTETLELESSVDSAGSEMTDSFEEDAIASAEDFEKSSTKTSQILDSDRAIRLAILGRPNVGKSTLLNRLYGGPRAVVHAEPGTTRDPLEIELFEEGRRFVLVDTAGIRRRAKAEDKIETVSVVRALESAAKSDVVVLVAEAPLGLTAQDAKIAQEALKRGRPLLIFFNKWDLAPEGATFSDFCQFLENQYEFLSFVPIFRLSGKTGLGVSRIFKEVIRVFEMAQKRLTTSQLNRVFRGLIETNPPPAVSGKSINLFYMTQIDVHPPHFVVFSNYPEMVPVSYERYLIRGLREAFDFEGVPIRIEFKQRKKRTPFLG